MVFSFWARRRWLDFRQGHSIYLIFVLSFMNFIIISYALALERVPFLQDMFPHMWIWGVFFVAVYIPSAVIIGHLHKKYQLATEQLVMASKNPILHKQMRIQNAMAEALEQLARQMQMKIEIPRWSEQEMGETRKKPPRK